MQQSTRSHPLSFGSYPTPQKLAQAAPEEVLTHIKTIGLAPTKAKNIVKTAQQLCERHQGEIPEDSEALQALPGVGRKTANVVTCARDERRKDKGEPKHSPRRCAYVSS